MAFSENDVVDIEIFDYTDDFDESRYSQFSNRDCDRIQNIMKRKGKVTWGDVYAPWLNNRKWYDEKQYVSPEEYSLFHTDPSTEMECIYDDSDGYFYWMPKLSSRYLADPEKEKEISEAANIPGVTIDIIATIVAFCGLAVWFSIIRYL